MLWAASLPYRAICNEQGLRRCMQIPARASDCWEEQAIEMRAAIAGMWPVAFKMVHISMPPAMPTPLQQILKVQIPGKLPNRAPTPSLT